MPIWNNTAYVQDDEPIVDSSIPISGVNDTLPPNIISQNMAQSAVNRLSALDNLNRPRPGVIARFQTANLYFDSIAHFGTGRFLYNSGPDWGIYDSRSQVSNPVSGGPAFSKGDQVYYALCDNVIYFTRGDTLYKYDPSVPGFGTNPIPSQWPTALYPIWAFSRLIYVNDNTLVISDLLDPEVWHPATQELTLDPVATDMITGQTMWQSQTLVVFRNGSTWLVVTGPNLDVPDWELNRTSASIGCCCHGTIVQCGVDVYFLSETGRGVYALSQMPSSDQVGVWMPISGDIKRTIDRINWAAVKCARANYWNGLYILSVPLDGATYNNYVLIYSVTLNSWQGTWCFDVLNSDYGFRDCARDRTNPDETLLLIGTEDGVVSEFTYPPDQRNYDTDLAKVQHPVESSLVTRSFTFSEAFNQIQPCSCRLQFLNSVDNVDVTIIANQENSIYLTNTITTPGGLTLPIAALPFDLDVSGYYYAPLSLMSIDICTELQVELEGTGNWTLFQIRMVAWETVPMTAT